MKYKIGDFIYYGDRRRAVIIHIVHIRGKQRVYFKAPHFDDGRIWNRWNTEVRPA